MVPNTKKHHHWALHTYLNKQLNNLQQHNLKNQPLIHQNTLITIYKNANWIEFIEETEPTLKNTNTANIILTISILQAAKQNTTS